MEDTVAEVMSEYIAERFTPEFVEEIKTSFLIFGIFKYTTHLETLPDILFDTSHDDAEKTQGDFLSLVQTSIDAILTAHGVTLIDDTDLPTKNQILTALYRVQHVEDPVPYLRIIETDLSNEERLAKIIDALSELSEWTVLDVLDQLSDELLTALTEHLTRQEAALELDSDDASDVTAIASNLKTFFTAVGTDNLATTLLENDVEINHTFDLYVPFVRDFVVAASDEDTAENLLSLFYLCRDTYADPVKAFTEHSELFITNHEHRLRVEAKFRALVNQVTHFKEATHEAKRLSTI